MMPGHNSTLVNEPDFEISVSSTHTLDDGKTENTIPRLVDSQHICSVHFSFSGTVDHSTSISPSDMLRSYVVQSFRNYLTLARSPFAHVFLSSLILHHQRTECASVSLISPRPFLTTTLRLPAFPALPASPKVLKCTFHRPRIYLTSIQCL